MTIATVGLLHPGAMGAAVGKVLTRRGRTVLWASEGRSAERRARARRGGPAGRRHGGRAGGPQRPRPGRSARRTARSTSRARSAPSPASTSTPTRSRRPPRAEIRDIVEAAGARYVDGGIIGPPPDAPTRRGSTSPAPTRREVAELFAGSSLEALVLDGEPTAASALKMAYAGWTKGTSGAPAHHARGGTRRTASRTRSCASGSTRSRRCPSARRRPRAGRCEGLALGGRDARDRRHAGRRRPPAGFHEAAAEVFERRRSEPGACAAPSQRLAATIRRRPWPVSPPSSPSPRARSPNSRATRRLRRQGQVPGVLYGGGDDAMRLRRRRARAASRARRPRRRGRARARRRRPRRPCSRTPSATRCAATRCTSTSCASNLDVAIHAIVALELIGGEEAPGAIEGGVLEHVTREINIEALPNDIPERLQLDVSAMQINDTLTLAAVTAPEGVTILDDLEETVVATLTPPQAPGRPRGPRRGGRARAGDRARRRGRGARRGRRGRGRGRARRGGDAADESSE